MRFVVEEPSGISLCNYRVANVCRSPEELLYIISRSLSTNMILKIASQCFQDYRQHTRVYQNRWFQKRNFWRLSKLAILVHQQPWYTCGWFFGTQKGIATNGFQNGKFWRFEN